MNNYLFRMKQQIEADNPKGRRLRRMGLTMPVPVKAKSEPKPKSTSMTLGHLLGITTDFFEASKRPDSDKRIMGFNPRYFNVERPELIHAMIGEEIGQGNFRNVFAHKDSLELVIKIDHSHEFTNVDEYKLWRGIVEKHREIAFDWLAPCYAISDDGRYLVQRRVDVLRSFDDMPDNIPSFLDDIDVENWGRLDGKIVCHDYALHTYYKSQVRFRSIKEYKDGSNWKGNNHIFFND